MCYCAGLMRKSLSTIGLFFMFATAACSASSSPTADGGGAAQAGNGGLAGTSVGASSAAGGTTSAPDGAIIPTGGAVAPADGAVIPTGGAAGSADAGSSFSGGDSSSNGDSSDGCTGDSSVTGDASVAPTPDGPTLSGPDVPLPESVVKASPPLLSFGEIAPGQVSPALAVTVTNTGPLVLITPTVAGSAFSIAGTTCGTAPAASCTVSVRFSPVTQGPANGVLTIAPGIAIPLSGTGSGTGSLTIAPTTALFSATVDVTSALTVFTVANPGGSIPASVTAKLDGANADQFAITSNKCLVPPASATTCAITVVFRPTSAGAKTAALTVSDATPGATPASATLSGSAVTGPMLTITGATDLGVVAIGLSGTSAAYTVTNSGQTATGALVVIAESHQFTIGSDLCTGTSLAPAKTCTFAITFRPTLTGIVTSLVDASSGGVVLASLPVHGDGLTVPLGAIMLAPEALDFGTISVGTVSAAKTFTVTNSGGDATRPLSVVENDGISSFGGAAQFSYASTCSAALAPTNSCQVVVTFQPTVVGSASATFMISDGTMSSPARTVTGTATTP